MFGNNPIRENETHLNGSTLAVQDIFFTLQGEGPYSGQAAVFVRLAGCNLACSFCDTEFESKIDNRMPIFDVVKRVRDLPRHRLVVLTGGEPLRQNVVPLIEALFNIGVRVVQIETAGTLWVPALESFITRDYESPDPRVVLVCSPKTPKIHPKIARWCTDYKYVISVNEVDPTDGLPVMLGRAAPVYRPWYDPNNAFLMQLDPEALRVWVSPCDPGYPKGLDNTSSWDRAQHDADWKANTDLAVEVALKFNYRLSLQVHKLVGLP